MASLLAAIVILSDILSIMERHILKNEQETEAFGLKLAESLKPGDIIALMGDLGAGKTTLSKAIARGLGIRDTITSPTFTIVCEYDSGRLPLYHFDVYRIHDSEELFEIGFEEYLHKKGVCLIEWANLLEDGMLPDEIIRINIEYGENENERILSMEK